MKMMLISKGIVQEDISNLFESIEEATSSYNVPSLTIIYAKDNVYPGWTYDGIEFHPPSLSEQAYDNQTNKFYPHNQYREILHSRTSNDTLQAMRKLREGNQDYDWQSWLDKLDAYNKAVEDTQYQETYPDKVVYPEYPQR